MVEWYVHYIHISYALDLDFEIIKLLLLSQTCISVFSIQTPYVLLINTWQVNKLS